jgi:purine-binding chemotaxis protein CheW
MGRMAEARKRAQRRNRSDGEGAASLELPAPVPSRAPAPLESSTPTGMDRPAEPPAGEEELVFPSEAEAPVSPRPGKIALPASGLASEILGRADVAAMAGPAPPSQDQAPRKVAAPEATPPPAETPTKSHNISFFAAPQREERKATEATEHLVTFLLGSEEYGVDVRAVQEIIRVTEITQVPRAPSFIKGVINLRGRIIPVVDLKRKLNLGEVAASRQARIVVAKLRERLIGLLVDGASQVLRVPVSSIEAAPDEVVEVNAHYLRGVAKLESRLVILLDLQAVLSLELGEGAQESTA